jgi:pimeloyl-ACP methyl ester carboxylesterase
VEKDPTPGRASIETRAVVQQTGLRDLEAQALRLAGSEAGPRPQAGRRSPPAQLPTQFQVSSTSGRSRRSSRWSKPSASTGAGTGSASGIPNLWSDRDKYLIEEGMLRSAECVSGTWRYERIEGASHGMQLDEPELINRLLLDFLG